MLVLPNVGGSPLSALQHPYPQSSSWRPPRPGLQPCYGAIRSSLFSDWASRAQPLRYGPTATDFLPFTVSTFGRDSDSHERRVSGLDYRLAASSCTTPLYRYTCLGGQNVPLTSSAPPRTAIPTKCVGSYQKAHRRKHGDLNDTQTNTALQNTGSRCSTYHPSRDCQALHSQGADALSAICNYLQSAAT